MAMLGVIVSGRLVQTDFQQIAETQFLTTILDADNVNHVVLFLTGIVPLPEGTAGLVYFSWPDSTAPPNWQYLGHISNAKPSVIFKISSIKRLHEMGDYSNVSTFGQQNICHNAQIGISIDILVRHKILYAPRALLDDNAHRTTSIPRARSSSPSWHYDHSNALESLANVPSEDPSPTTNLYLTFGQKMLENFMNYISSFAVTQNQMVPNPNETFVPLSTLQNWYTTFERRLALSPNFWKS